MYASISGSQRERTIAKVIMILASILYPLSMVPWLVTLIASAFLYDAPENVRMANVVMAGLLGWPVLIIAGLIIGWRGLRLRKAILGALLPLIFGLVMAVIAVGVNPTFWGF